MGLLGHSTAPLYKPDLAASCWLSGSLVQAELTDNHASPVDAVAQNVLIYDTYGNLLGPVSIPLNVTTIQPGDTVYATADDPYENAATCVLNGYQG
jgi:hypothetical protein